MDFGESTEQEEAFLQLKLMASRVDEPEAEPEAAKVAAKEKGDPLESSQEKEDSPAQNVNIVTSPGVSLISLLFSSSFGPEANDSFVQLQSLLDLLKGSTIHPFFFTLFC